jgi:hypothetical protein
MRAWAVVVLSGGGRQICCTCEMTTQGFGQESRMLAEDLACDTLHAAGQFNAAGIPTPRGQVVQVKRALEAPIEAQRTAI